MGRVLKGYGSLPVPICFMGGRAESSCVIGVQWEGRGEEKDLGKTAQRSFTGRCAVLYAMLVIGLSSRHPRGS